MAKWAVLIILFLIFLGLLILPKSSIEKAARAFLDEKPLPAKTIKLEKTNDINLQEIIRTDIRSLKEVLRGL